MDDDLQPPASSAMACAIGFFFSFRAVIPLFCVRLLGTEPRTGAEVSLALSFFLLGLVCFHSLGPGSRSLRSLLALPSSRWVLFFLAFSFCSLAWSETVSLSTSFAYWCGIAADVAIVALLLRTGSTTGVSHSLMKGFLCSTCCLALLAWIMPAQPDLRLGDEEFFNTNQIGNLCAFAILLAQYLMRRKDGKWGLATAFLALSLVRSLSKTTIVAFLLSEAFILIQDRSISRKTKLLLMTTAIMVILVFWGLFEAYYDIYTSAGNQAETLTGRIAIWAYVLNALPEHPWIGHGFDSLWKVVPPFGSDRFEARHAENEVLQQVYVYGVMGIVMLTGLYGSVYRQIRKLPRGPVRVMFLSILLFVVIRGLAEAEPFDLLLPLWFIVLISTLMGCPATAEQEVRIISAPAGPDFLYSR
ncbi:MAG: O-antigen ligase family protein [Acidobacteriaceae bacterium]